MTFTLGLIIITCIVSFIGFSNPDFIKNLVHSPFRESRTNEYYRWVTSGFIHADIMHLFVNMFVLHSFGTYVEELYGERFGSPIGGYIFVLVYLIIIIMANISTYYKHKDWHGYSALGASGGVAGILFIFILHSPWQMLGVMMIIPVPAIIFGALYLWYESYAAKNINDNIGHEAHFFGAIAGILLAIISLKGILTHFIDELIHNFPL